MVSFRERFRDDYTVDARHILIQVDETDLDTESATYEADLEARKAEAKAQAEELLAQWQAGDATEDSFAQLANENSSDSGSNTNGGLYEQIVVGSMVEEFNDWCFDASRKPGDTGIVYGDNGSYKGYHIMYFVGTDTADWKTQAQNQLLSSDYSAWYEEKTAGYTAEQVEAGIQYVG